MKKIKGTIKHIELETKFWGIISQDGTQYEIINMPEQLKYPDATVRVKLEELDLFTVNMWGTPAKIISFQTLKV